jgi:hypothetical protein
MEHLKNNKEQLLQEGGFTNKNTLLKSRWFIYKEEGLNLNTSESKSSREYIRQPSK